MVSNRWSRDSVRWIALEGFAIVASILLAFWIDASWDGWQERREEQRILGSLQSEFRSNQAHLTERTQFHKDVEHAIRLLLNEAALPASMLSDDKIDALIGTASWFDTSSTFEMSAVDSVVLGGNLSIIDNESLRQRITGWSRDVAEVMRTEAQDYDTFSDVWMPFLRDNAYLPQVHNAIDTQPGTGEEDYIPDLPLGPHATKHSDLLKDRGFQNVLLHRLWVQGDILNKYKEIEPALSTLIQLLDDELGQ